MRKLYIKQKVFSLGEKFTVKDEEERDVYFVEGSFMKIPKTFTLMDAAGNEVALIRKKIFSLLPRFVIEVNGRAVLTIKKGLSFFKSRYFIEAAGIEVQGNWLDMEFSVFRNGKLAGQVSKEWFTWGDSYKVEIIDEALETLMVALVTAIDCVKEEQASLTSAIPIDV